MGAQSHLRAALCRLLAGETGMKIPTVSTTLAATLLLAGAARAQPDIPLPEHPRPDFERPAWVNLNGTWQFRFDKGERGAGPDVAEGRGGLPAVHHGAVPVGIQALRRSRQRAASAGTPARSRSRRAGRGSASSSSSAPPTGTPPPGSTGKKLGEHQGGYTPFEFELTPHARPGTPQRLTLRVDDVDRAFKLEGKQGYGNARGIWQTPYLEARGTAALGDAALHARPRRAQGDGGRPTCSRPRPRT